MMRYTGIGILSEYDSVKRVCSIAVLHEDQMMEVAKVKEQFTEEERQTIIAILRKTGHERKKGIFRAPPGICLYIGFESIINYKLKSPVYLHIAVAEKWTACTWVNLQLSQYEKVAMTNPDKIIWDSQSVTKEMYLDYLMEVSDFMLPFLQNRYLTVKRYPEGVGREGFYQKSTPEYAPDFVKAVQYKDIKYTVCSNIETLLWLGNQASIEFHIPFNELNEQNPKEIVFDLDPPEIGDLRIAVKAALEMKQLLDQFQLTAYVKLSGRKGIQIHLPLNEATISYSETRILTEFIALYLVNRFPDHFTIERMKKNRGKRLYIDYIQHDRDKTIICPYSPRETVCPCIAAPLFWDEVNIGLKSEDFTMKTVKERVGKGVNPFATYFTVTQSEQVKKIIDFIKENHVRE